MTNPLKLINEVVHMNYEQQVQYTTFNQQEFALKVINELKKNRPGRVFVSTLGKSDEETFKATSSSIANFINWKCDVQIRSDHNSMLGMSQPAASDILLGILENRGVNFNADFSNDDFFKLCDVLMILRKQNYSIAIGYY